MRFRLHYAQGPDEGLSAAPHHTRALEGPPLHEYPD